MHLHSSRERERERERAREREKDAKRKMERMRDYHASLLLMLVGLFFPIATCAFRTPTISPPPVARVSRSSSRPPPRIRPDRHSAATTTTTTTSTIKITTTMSLFGMAPKEEEWDVVVVGSGVGGLCASSMCAKYGLGTLCLEAHEHAGGVSHSFERKARKGGGSGGEVGTGRFVFDSGPSLLSGMSSCGTNPLRQVLDAIGTSDKVEWINYDGWMIHDTSCPLTDDRSSFRLTTGNGGEWEDAIKHKAGIESSMEFVKFRNAMMGPNGLSKCSALIPPMALRGDVGAVLTMSSYLLKFLLIGTRGALLTGPFTRCMEKYGLRDEFNRKWFDYLAFALSGLDAAHTQAAPVAYTMIDLHKDGAVLDYPRGGMDSLISALVEGLEMKRRGDDEDDGVVAIRGGELRLKSRVERFILVEEDGKARCVGVEMKDGTRIRARRGVICNAPLWNMAKMLEDSVVNDDIAPKNDVIATAVREVREQANAMEMSGSFMHLHLGIPSDGLPIDLDCHHSVLDLERGITEEQNLIIVSIPTVFDPTLAPLGYHVIHAYTAASENFDDWNDKLDKGYDDGKTEQYDYRRGEAYDELKETKAEALWIALERIIPDIRERARRPGSVVEVGTPLTHRRFNRRYRGTYGPAPSNGKEVWELPGPKTPISGLLACGDTTFPGE
jgi:phytoene dehydrogenase-like protein